MVALTTAERDGAPVAVTGLVDNTLRIWDLRTGTQVGPPLMGHTRSVNSVSTVQVEGRTVLVSTAGELGAPQRAETRFWDLASGAPIGTPLVGHPVGGRLLTTVGGARPLLSRPRATGRSPSGTRPS
jgi:FOG: WD40 repeat